MCFRSLFHAASLLALASSVFAEGQTAKGTCDVGAAFERANAQLAAHQYEGAAHSLDEIRDCSGLSSLESFQLGWLYGRARHFDTALKIFDRVPEDVPDRSTHGFAVALSRFELGDYHGAANQLVALDSAGLADAKSANLLAVSYSKLGLYRQAYGVLAQETRKNPTDLNTRLNLITVCAEGGDLKSAAEVASETTKLFPASADAFVGLGAAEALLGQLKSAYNDFSRSAELDPKRADVRFFLALMDYKMDEFGQAVQILHTAIKGGIEDSDLHYLMAECLLKTDSGNTNAAIEELDAALTINADSVSSRTLRGKLLLETGRANRAVSDLEFATEHDPESRSAAYNLARAYRAVGRDGDARAIFAKIHDQPASTLSETGDRRLTDSLSEKSTAQR
jgi:tetratricopeptide (TPR) repeat protein